MCAIKVGQTLSMKTLYLFTNDYPYGHIENFLEVEINYLCARFEKVVIVPISGGGKPMRPVPQNCEVLQPIRHGKKDALLHGFSIRRLPFFVEEFFKHKVWQKKSRIKSYVTAVINANNYLHSSQVKEILKQLKPDDVFYSYWGKVGTDLWPFVKGKAKLVSRFHGDWDLWGSCEDYAPFRDEVGYALSAGAFISEKGRRYFLKHWHLSNAVVFPLGTINGGLEGFPSKDGVLRVVSCSAIYPVKRVDLIYQALQLIEDREVEWTHIGGGRGGKETEDVKTLKELVTKTRHNVKVLLLGAMDNAKVLQYYQENPIDVFVNVSTIEGVPVSIMEAISFNIPAVATDVGATSEVVSDESGILISSNPTAAEVKNAILRVADGHFTPREYWDKHYNAERNYTSWANFLYEL